MKRCICVLLSSLLVFCMFTIHPATLSLAESPLYGDGNFDRSVNAADALQALQVAVGKATVNAEVFDLLDVDDSQQLDVNDALMILKYAVGLLDRFPVDQPSEDPSYPEEDWLNMSMEEITDTLSGNTPASAITDYYKIHQNGGMIYNPLSREMESGNNTKYNIPQLAQPVSGALTLDDGSTLTYSVPTNITAYDMIPITYSLQNGSDNRNALHVEATTFERGNGTYYDLCLPGNIKLDFQYDGYVAADNNTKNRPYLSRDLKSDDQGNQYPQYETGKLIASDTVPANKPVWFKFTIKNTGNTILDGDGNGTFCFQPFLTKGDFQLAHTNMFTRLTEDLYPGESVEMWFYFGSTHGLTLNAGTYQMSIQCLVRNEEAGPDDWAEKIWHGYLYGTAYKTITVTQSPTVTKKSDTYYIAERTAPTRNTWLHTYEEFTTSYDSWLAPTTIDSNDTHILYVQPAAWSEQLVLKFMSGNKLNMQSVKIPLHVNTDSITVKLNQTADNFIITDEGKKYPAVASQTMCDMRVNDSLSPYANEAQLDELLDMRDCGVNLVATTEAFNIGLLTKASQSRPILNNQDANWFVSDALRKLGMRMEGFTGYSYNTGTTFDAAYWFTRDSASSSGNYSGGYNSKALDLANGLRGLYQFMRWGDNWYINGKNQVIFNTEDTRGWMRIDFNARALTNNASKEGFRNWLQNKYGSIDALNDAWGTYYRSFAAINPTAGVANDHDWDSHVPNVAPNAKLPEWSAAINDWDIYRTIERATNYQNALNTITSYQKSGIPIENPQNAKMSVRTEGANVTAIVPYNTESSHLRHTYYSQRRCALIPQILAKSGAVAMHSDYITLPYSVKELEQLTASSTRLGITFMPLMQSNRMRDIAINKNYGDPAYRYHYNLTGENVKGAYINTQTSVFEAFKAVYENGGIPGVLWEDYLCDGYVTETQQKEMKFYSQKIRQMMQSEQAQIWATSNVPDVKDTYDLSFGLYSYPEAYIQAEVDAAINRRQ